MPTSVNSVLDVRSSLQQDRMLRAGYEDFRAMILNADGDGDGSAATTGPNLAITDKNVFEVEGVGTMDSALLVINGGLLLTTNMTSDNVGIEIQAQSAAATRGRGVFVVGTDEAYFSSTFTLADVSGTDFCFSGFRKVEARQTSEGALTYADYALLAPISGDIKIYTRLNAGTQAITDTTEDWTDGQSHKLTVIVAKNGKVYFEIDGHTPAAEPATRFQFDSGDSIAWMWRIQNATDVANGTLITELAWGAQGDSIAPRRPGHTSTSGV